MVQAFQEGSMLFTADIRFAEKSANFDFPNYISAEEISTPFYTYGLRENVILYTLLLLRSSHSASRPM
jgi:hypothetical protein